MYVYHMKDEEKESESGASFEAFTLKHGEIKHIKKSYVCVCVAMFKLMK